MDVRAEQWTYFGNRPGAIPAHAGVYGSAAWWVSVLRWRELPNLCASTWRVVEATGADITVRHPGYKMDLIEDDGWRRQISKEIARKKVDLLLLVYSLEDTTSLTGAAQDWLLKSLSVYAKEVFVFDSLGSVRWDYWFTNGVESSDREFFVYQGRGDLGIGTYSQSIGEVMTYWADSEHDIHYSPVSTENLVAVLQESYVEERIAHAFPVEARQDEVELSSTLDAVLDSRDNRTTFMDESELADFLDTLLLAGFLKEESDRRKEWVKLPRKVRLGVRRLHNMTNHKRKEVLSEEPINAAKLFKCESCRVSQGWRRPAWISKVLAKAYATLGVTLWVAESNYT